MVCLYGTYAIRQMAGSGWGESPSAILQVHQVLVSRPAYVIPYQHTFAYLKLKLQHAHRARITDAMGVHLPNPTVRANDCVLDKLL